MAVSDIHSVWESTRLLRDYAKKHKLFLIFLGDILDGGEQPGMVLDTVLFDFMRPGKAAFVIGNHERKYYSRTLGNPVILKSDQLDTIAYVKQHYGDIRFFDERVRQLIHNANTANIHSYGSWVFTHGADHKSYWSNETEKLAKVQIVQSLYGEVDGARMPLKFTDRIHNLKRYIKAKRNGTKYVPRLGFPQRTYRWCDYVPDGYNVVVGHDRRPMNKPKFDAKPLVYVNEQNGSTYFTDTGSGKNVGGGVTGAVFSFVEDDLKLERFEFFSNK